MQCDYVLLLEKDDIETVARGLAELPLKHSLRAYRKIQVQVSSELQNCHRCSKANSGVCGCFEVDGERNQALQAFAQKYGICPFFHKV